MHVSFVRSVQMDSFKVNEVKRMEQGGNEAWRSFWDQHADGGAGNKTAWDTTAIGDRYTGYTGDEYKERLSAKIEGREYVPVPKKEKPAPRVTPATAGSGRSTPQGGRRTPLGTGGRNSPAPPRSGTPSMSGIGPMSQKEKNESYFAKMGAENASRPEDLAPSQGGKYGGFGSGYTPDPKPGAGGSAAIPNIDEFQRDPMAALTKGFGWFTTTVGKTAKSVNDGWVQPGIQKVRPLTPTYTYLHL